MTHTFKVGDRVRVTGNSNEHCHEIGAEVTLTEADVDGTFLGDGKTGGWIVPCDMEPVTPEQPQGQLLADLNPQPGDVVECVDTDRTWWTVGTTYVVGCNLSIIDDGGSDSWGHHDGYPPNTKFRIVSRAARAPEPWSIFTNREAHGLLTDAQRAAFKAWDGVVERYDGTYWVQCSPNWRNASIYRAIPKPSLTPDIIPWAAMLPEWKWAARDANGEVWTATDPMMQVKDDWSGPGVYCRIDHLLPGVTIGTVDWKDSLQQRPEGE